MVNERLLWVDGHITRPLSVDEVVVITASEELPLNASENILHG